jgi:cell division protein FtsB
MATRTSQKPGRILLRRLAWAAGALTIVLFTVEGGEYGTRDLWSQKGRKARLDAEVAQLRLDVDSLRLELKLFKTDNSKLERLAREKYGMVKGSKELLYRFESTSGRAGADTNSVDSSGKRER